MVGENPHGAEAQGIDVFAVRIGAVMVGSALMALGGAFLTLRRLRQLLLHDDPGPGAGCASRWWCSRRGSRERRCWAPCSYGLFDAYQLRLQHVAPEGVPYQLFLMMPYLLSILALIVMSRRAAYPRALMQPYRRGDR